ncbi:hypothetical protein F4777DRAFT_539770 [Nemania sp. FL0916]|nr:hypothetical protein F4777DRAFT_539770 [Nemania sp. FL0916]
MAFDSNPFWGSCDIDIIRCHTPQALALLNNPPCWDGFVDFKESVDPKSSLELLQRPVPCSYEPKDEWLAEFRRLQEVHDRASNMSSPTISVPLGRSPRASTTSNSGNTDTTANTNSHRSEKRGPPSFLEHSPAKSPKVAEPARVQGSEIDRPTPTSAGQPSTTDGGISGYPTAIYPSMYHHFAVIPADNNQPARHDRDVEKAVGALREMEQSFQAETRRRMTQVEQSRPTR